MGNEEKKKYGLRLRDRKKSASETEEFLEMPAVPEGWVYCVQQVAVNNETGAYTGLYIGTRSGETYYVVEHTPSPAAATWYTWQGELFLHAGEVFSVKFVGATVGDVLEAVAFGSRQKAI